MADGLLDLYGGTTGLLNQKLSDYAWQLNDILGGYPAAIGQGASAISQIPGVEAMMPPVAKLRDFGLPPVQLDLFKKYPAPPDYQLKPFGARLPEELLAPKELVDWLAKMKLRLGV